MNKHEEIIDYYRHCDESYQHWGESEAYDMHYGYWTGDTATHGESLSNMNAIIADQMGIEGCERVLDAGCGVGATCMWIAGQFDAVRLVGLTISPLQARKAGGFARRSSFADRVAFLRGDYLQTPFSGESFDVVYALESSCHAPDKHAFLKEAHRVLRPGGRLVIHDYFQARAPSSLLERKVMKWHLQGWAIPHLAAQDSFAQSLASVGFGKLRWSDRTRSILQSSRIMFRRGCLGLLPDRLLWRRHRVRFANTITCFAQYLSLKMGLWRYLGLVAERA